MEENTQEAQPQKPDLLSILKDKPNAPDQAILDKWKAEFGSIYVSGFSEEEIYIFRAITRSEYKKIQIDNQKIATIQDPDEAISAQMAAEEKIVSMCLLWPKLTPEQLAKDKGGTVSTLLEQVMQNSNFMSPAQASMLVMRL